MAARIEEAVTFAGQVTFAGAGNPTLGAGCVIDANVNAAAGISASKHQAQYSIEHTVPGGVAGVTTIDLVHICRGAGVVVAFEVVCEVPPTVAAGLHFHADLYKSTALGAPVTVLTGVVNYDSIIARTVLTGTLGGTSDIALVDGDLLYVVIIPQAGTGAGAQAADIHVTVTIREAA
jgi:hypothetical protein